MATGRIGVTPTLGVRWSLAPAGGTTALSGLDDNSVSLVYSVGYEQVYRNGVLLSRGNDYTATDGTTVTLTEATITGDIIEIFAQQLVPLTDAISKGQFTAKGTLLSATAASTPGVLGVGADGTVLTAASGEATGLEWATPSGWNPNYQLLNAGGTALTAATTITVSGISGINSLFVIVDQASSASVPSLFQILLNADTGANYTQVTHFIKAATPNEISADYSGLWGNSIYFASMKNNAVGQARANFQIDGTGTAGLKTIEFTTFADAYSTTEMHAGKGAYQGTSAITSISVKSSNGNFDNGTIYVYGA